MSSRPWQLDWQRPVWQCVQDVTVEPGGSSSVTATAAATTTTTPSVPQGRVMDHTAASVVAQEVSLHGSTRSNDNIINERDVEYVLTATLIQSSAGRTSRQYHHHCHRHAEAADVLVLEVIRQKNVPSLKSEEEEEEGKSSKQEEAEPVLERLQSRTLRWPASVLQNSAEDQFDGEEEAEEEEDHIVASASHDEDDASTRSHPNRFLDWFRRQGRRQRRKVTRPAVGMVSVCLCRLPPEDPIAAQADALDVLHLLSLGQRQGLTETQQEWLQLKLEEQRGNEPTQQQQQQNPTDLILACLTSNGKVHIYSPWSLLNPTDREQGLDQVEDSMASLLLGEGLLSTIQTSMLPLSQPLRTLRLSVPFLKKSKTMWKEEHSYRQHQPPPPMQIEELPTRSDSQGDVNLFSAWDDAIWDSILDRPSLPFQTKSNVATHAIFALEYLVIAGKGHRRKKQRQRQHPSPRSQTDSVSNWTDWEDASGSVASASAASTTHLHQHHFYHDSDNGGFVTFVSLRTYSEVRTVYLPFVPQRLSPIAWGGMTFVMVLGFSRAVLVRTDAAELLTVTNGKPPSIFREARAKGGEGQNLSTPDEEDEFSLSRFQVLPIELPDADMALAPRLVGSSATTTPPAIAFLAKTKAGRPTVSIHQRTLQSIHLRPVVETSEWFHQYGTRVQGDHVAVISTTHTAAHVAQIETSTDQLICDPWCHLGQGWCLIGLGGQAHFVCFQGATSANGAFVLDLPTQVNNCIKGLASDVIPIFPFVGQSGEVAVSSSELSQVSTTSVDSIINVQKGQNLITDSLQDVVTAALRDISSSLYQNDVVTNSPLMSPRRKSFSFTRREKSVRLLRHCSSWEQLDESQATKHRFGRQRPVVTVRLGDGTQSQYSLSLRQTSVEGGAAAPFQNVLAWLACKEDFFTASSLALDLLHDADSLRHLWKAHNKMDDVVEMSMLESLLDGIAPVYDASDEEGVLLNTLTQLADMTLGCLVKGGLKMSSTLNHFVKRDRNYDPARACIMLVGVTPECITAAEEQDGVIPRDYDSKLEHGGFGEILWPVAAVLEVGLARESLPTAIVLLNAAIPDEIRSRHRSDVPAASPPSLSLCKALISYIVAAGNEATELLLKLVDDQSGKPYWESLDHKTRRELSLLSVTGKFPMLRQIEVRTWVIVQLRRCLESSEDLDSANILDTYPNEWLVDVCGACLANAGCDLGSLLRKGDNMRKKSGPQDELVVFKNEINQLRHSLLRPAPSSGGLDVDIFIPALLILKVRGEQWHDSSDFSTRSVLNAACYVAGRHNEEIPMFPMDGATLMRECVLAGDVQAGANLVGGKNGLVLECSCLLIQGTGMSMEEAEKFLLSETLPRANKETEEAKNEESFSVQYSHKLLLWLLDEHVLSIRKYGDFDSSHSRGKVDPVFAARTILRTWWRLTKDEHPKRASAWLFEWLEKELSLDVHSINQSSDESVMPQRSPHRLACAALTRALVWASKDGAVVDDTLANRLYAPSEFLVRLSLSCCGLVESLPGYVVENSWRQMEGTRMVPPIRSRPAASSPLHTTSPRPGQTPTRVNEAIDESFMSAVSSLVDM